MKLPSFFHSVPALATAVAGLILVLPAGAMPVPSRLFGDHAVLQRGGSVAIWGTASPTEHVTVSYAGVEAAATADAAGRWRLALPLGTHESASPGELIFESTQGRVVSHDVALGDVWLCGGQSNMAFLVRKMAGAPDVIAQATLPGIRQFRVKTSVADQPATSVEDGEWAVCSPETVREFSAVGYVFAREMHGRGGVAQGLVNASWGGTRIETWMSREALSSKPAFDVINMRWKQTLADYPARKTAYEKDLEAWTAEKKAATAGGGSFAKKMPVAPRGAGSADTPSGAFNAMIAPLIPLSVRGVLWYQGEQNWERPQEYGALFQSLITDWRQRWERPELPFLFVQLPNYGAVTGTHWASLREGQASALRLPATHMAVTVDVGNPKELHPTNKQDVGHRLALLARRWVFNEDIIAEGPRFKSAKPEGSALRVLFDPPEGKLVLRDVPADGVAFEEAGADGVFKPAKAVVEGATLRVTAEGVSSPVALRYAWRDSPAAIVFNEAGLPAAPFRTDSAKTQGK